MTETTIGREPVQVVEIQQPLCANTYGTAPCTASGTAALKCFNTRATCQDTANFTLGAPLSLFFASGKTAERGISGAPYLIPSLISVSTAPTRINLAGANPDAQGLGNRAVCGITLMDHAHTDRVVDPYLSGRGGDPLSKASFWSRWMVRNKYRQNVEIRVYEGYAGQALSAMTKRTYFLQSIAGPDDSGRVKIQGKDILAKVEERKAQAPVQSPGELYVDILSSDTNFEVSNAVVADYPSSGTLRIDNEVMKYGSRSTISDRIRFNGVTRGTDNTTAKDHDAKDSVQECLRYKNAAVDTVLEDLLTTYGGVDSAWLDTASWATEVTDYMVSYKLEALITKPTSVTALISEIQEQVLCFLWWDERTALVNLKAVRGIDAALPTITAETNIISGSFSLTEMPRQRASQVWIYYNIRNPTDNHKSADNYHSSTVIADLESETDELYGEASVRKIFARWLVSSATADSTASKISTRYVDIPSQCRFRMDAKDRAYWVGDTLTISHHLDVDQYGDRRLRNWTIISAEEVVPGEVVEYLAEDTTLYGKIHFVMANGAADYPGASAPFKNCYVGDSSGLLSDGTDCGRVT